MARFGWLNSILYQLRQCGRRVATPRVRGLQSCSGQPLALRLLQDLLQRRSLPLNLTYLFSGRADVSSEASEIVGAFDTIQQASDQLHDQQLDKSLSWEQGLSKNMERNHGD